MKSNWSQGLGSMSGDPSDFYVLERQAGKVVEMINFCLKSGHEDAFTVIQFDRITYQAEGIITLHSRMATIQIKGQHLNALHHYLVARRVKEIREYTDKPVEETELCIQHIKIYSDYDTVH